MDGYVHCRNVTGRSHTFGTLRNMFMASYIARMSRAVPNCWEPLDYNGWLHTLQECHRKIPHSWDPPEHVPGFIHCKNVTGGSQLLGTSRLQWMATCHRRNPDLWDPPETCLVNLHVSPETCLVNLHVRTSHSASQLHAWPF